MHCDSAYWYPSKDFDAYGNIKITKGRSYSILGDELIYKNITHTAHVQGNVILQDNKMTLTAPGIDYNTQTKIAHYNGNGKITSKSNQNSDNDEFVFIKNVVLSNPKYILKTSKLKYNNALETAYFIAPTVVTSKSDKILCKAGFYNTKKEYGEFYNHPTLYYGKQMLQGDTVVYNGLEKWGIAKSNVLLKDTTENQQIIGGYGEYWGNDYTRIVTKKPRFASWENQDTLWVRADTIWAKEDSLVGNQLKAFHHVLFFHPDFQGKSDSLFFQSNDSTMYLYSDPIFWNENRQISGDTLELHINNNQVNQFWVKSNAFVVGELGDGSTHFYDQMKGRNMQGILIENEIKRVNMFGNGQLIYFPKDDKKPNPEGMNKAECSNIQVRIKERKIQKITLVQEPDSNFIPLKECHSENQFLPGFTWRQNEKPTRKQIDL
jgi:lipopolysaccharide export system protein LptA